MAQSEPTYYELLKLKPTATPSDIRAAYRNLAKTAHPDAGGSTQAMAALTEAYQTLKDPIARLEYDQSLAPVPLAPAPAASTGRPTASASSHYRDFSTRQITREQAQAVRAYVWSFVQEFGWLTFLGGLALSWLSVQPIFGASGWIIGICGAALIYWAALQVVYLAWPELKLSNYQTARAPHRASRMRLKRLITTSLLWLPLGLIGQIVIRLYI